MLLSIVLPAYNEETRLGLSLQKIIALCRRELAEWELIVVDDGSSDRTAEIAREFSDVRLLRNVENRGKGFSVRRGLLEARGDAILFSDVDLSTPIREALPLLKSIEGGADVAIASRRFDSGKVVDRRIARRLMAFVFRTLVKVIVVRGFHDTQCGFKMFRRRAARDLLPRQRLDGWAFDVELLFLARRFGYRVVEVPVEWRESDETRLGFWSPAWMLLDLIRIRWNQLLGRYARHRAGGAVSIEPTVGGEEDRIRRSE